MAPSNKRIATEFEKKVQDVLQHRVDAFRRGIKVYESLQNLNEVIGAEYGDRVLYELIQNAHDAHRPGDKGSRDKGTVGRGKIAIKLVIRSDSDGELYIANGGGGFRPEDVEAINNLAISAKEVGEGIGNKGLGFRSIEALTDDVRIFSQEGRGKPKAKRFNGYCFRFSSPDEIEAELHSYDDIDATARKEMAGNMPRYMVPKFLKSQPAPVTAFAGQGYATVIVAPLKTVEAVNLARKQVDLLANLNVPLLLFLDRIAHVQIDVDQFDQQPVSRRLKRRQKSLASKLRLKGSALYEVDVGDQRKFLVVRHEVDKERVRDAVEKSIPQAPQLKHWLNWQGQPTVSVAVGLSNAAVTNARLYNFLPMGEEATSPLKGYLDAPFFTEIDRRNVDLWLPLNDTLLEAAAEACAGAVLSIAKHGLPVKQQAVFDLFAWTGTFANKLDDALHRHDSSLGDAKVIPAIADKAGNRWASISTVSIWPDGPFAVLKDQEVAKHVGARLVSGELDTQRLVRLQEIAAYRMRLTLAPSSGQLTNWSEAFAKSLLDRKSAPRTWSRFYNDLSELFRVSNVELSDLVGRRILLDRSDKLKLAVGPYDTVRAKVYVRRDVPTGTQKKAGVPLPPKSLARRYSFLHAKVTLKSGTLDRFIEAGLVMEYDPIEALAGLKSALVGKASVRRREEALDWAFQVWRASGDLVDDKLQDAGIHVPTLSGWRLANHAMFSSSWTQLGQTLESYLVDSAKTSADCRRARDLMLIGHKKWPVSVKGAKQDWVRFLTLIDVGDGLRPVPAGITREGSPANLWNGVIENGNSDEGLDGDWCAEVNNVSFHFRADDYIMQDEAWRFPGQIEHEALSEGARENLCRLVFEHLKIHGTRNFHFDVGRFRRFEHEWDGQRLPTPLASFLRTKAWIAVTTREGVAFRRPNACWASRARRGGLPMFMDRIPETVADLSDDDDLAELAFGEELGLRDWQSKTTAVERLSELAGVATSLASNDRSTARTEYRRAWEDVVTTDVSLPSDLALIVRRRDQLAVLSGDTEAPAAVLVTEDAQSPAVRILSNSGQPVLEVDQGRIEEIAALLENTGAFVPRSLNGEGIQLLVDGNPFDPRSGDEFLTSQGLDWLPEVIAIGNEIRGEQLERGVHSTTIDKRVRAIRFRRCKTLALMVDNKVLSSSDQLDWYAYPHDDLPTLMVTDDVKLDWNTLAGPLSGDLLRLVHRQLKTPRFLLSQLAIQRLQQSRSTDLSPPSDEELKTALECDIATVRDHRHARGSKLEHILDLLAPIVAYYADVGLTRQLRRDAEQQGETFDPHEWLELHMGDMKHSPQELTEACRHTASLSELRMKLALDYEGFNNALLKLGESPLSNETELQRMYQAHLDGMRPELIERLRRHHADDFRQGRDLAEYVERKNLTFLEFNSDWTFTRETLDMEVVEAHVSKLLNDVLGKDQQVKLESLERVLTKNRKSVGDFIEKALSVVPIWCKKNGVPVPAPWSPSEGQAVAQHLENSGLLDFEAIDPKSIPAFCRRAACWPAGMEETIDQNLLGIDKGDIEKQDRQSQKVIRQREISKRSVTFAGESLDTSDPMFPRRFEEIAEESLSRDETWFDRCRQRTQLEDIKEVSQSNERSSRSGKRGDVRQRRGQLTEVQRQTMGLASEWLAFKFLSRRHSKFVNENCWISENRARFFGGGPGNDSAGYDFLVKTPKADYMYEVKSSLEDTGEFELTANELRVATEAFKDGPRRYRILYVPYVFSPDKWRVLELPNPMGEATRSKFDTIGSGSLRLRFRRK